MRSVLVIGAGLVATALIKALKATEAYEVRLHNRTTIKGKTLAAELGVGYVSQLDTIASPDYAILAVSDQAIPEIELPTSLIKNCIVVHTSGTVSIEAIDRFPSYGLLYPLDSFGYDGDHFMEGTPILIEGSNSETLEKIRIMASSLSNQIFEVDAASRPVLHMAAVISNNFVNALLKLSFNELDKADIEPKVLYKLLQTTLYRALNVGPANSQTGPAIRGDISTLQKHLELIEHSDLKDLYILMSKIINPKITDEDLK